MGYENYILIDSGLDLNNNFLKDKIIDGIGIQYADSGKIIINDNYQDENGHGTSCASIISTINKNTKVFVIKVTNKNGLSKHKLLLKALEYTKNLNIRVVCVSLATILAEAYEGINEICGYLNKQGKIMVSSLHNYHDFSLPASLNSVVGVSGTNFDGSLAKFYYQRNQSIQALFDRYPHFAYTIDNKLTLFAGNSKSNAIATATILNILDQNKNIKFKELEYFLEKKSAKHLLMKINKNRMFFNGKISNVDREIINQILNIINSKMIKNLNIEDIMDIPIITKKTGLNFNNCHKFLNEVEKVFKVSFDYLKLSSFEFCTIYKLTNLIKNAKI